MPRPLIRASILMVALVAASAALAGDIYEWKDAKGVMHYSETAPAGVAYKQRSIDSSDSQPVAATAPAATPAAKPAMAANAASKPQCVTAQKNMELLQGKGALQQDTDGDGKPDKTLNDAERASQLELARATLNADCLPPRARP